MSKKKTCCVCHTEYEHCNSCPKTLTEPSWKASFCSENCRDIYNALARFNMGKLSREEARDIIDECNIAMIDNYTEKTIELIGRLYEDESDF